MATRARESITEKAERYLGEARLSIRFVDDGKVRATCRGGELYELGCDHGEFFCGCPAWGLCSHIVALSLVLEEDDDAG